MTFLLDRTYPCSHIENIARTSHKVEDLTVEQKQSIRPLQETCSHFKNISKHQRDVCARLASTNTNVLKL